MQQVFGYVAAFAMATALSMNPATVQARSSQWYFVADGADRVLFVDTGSIQRDGDTVRYSSSLIVRDPADDMGEQRAFMQVDCTKRTMQWPMVMRYGRDDRRLDESAVSYAGEETAEPGTMASAELDFVCGFGRADAGQADTAFALAVDQSALAEALIANTDPAVRPTQIHARLVADPATPRIRSTAPSPEMFGTRQQVRAGQPVVPPRDYGRGTGIPALNEYEADEVGRIYDVSYQGLDDGELAFEIRGYGPEDLVHPGSGQTIRFARDVKEAQVRDIAITIEEAGADHLVYRARRQVEDERAMPGTDR